MLAAKHDFTIERGSVFTRLIQWNAANGNPQDLTGYTAKMDVRPSEDSDVLIKSLSTDDSTITLGLNGLITLKLDATATSALSNYNKAVYALEMYPGGLTGEAVRILEGFVFISLEVTQ